MRLYFLCFKILKTCKIVCYPFSPNHVSETNKNETSMKFHSHLIRFFADDDIEHSFRYGTLLFTFKTVFSHYSIACQQTNALKIFKVHYFETML